MVFYTGSNSTERLTMKPQELVRSDAHEIMGVNYYWVKHHELGISDDELDRAGVVDDHVWIHINVARRLKTAMTLLRAHGYTVLVKDGYRSAEMYELAHQAFARLKGEGFVSSRFNLIDKPHTTGRAIDLALIDIESGREVWLRDDRDGPGAAFVGFYRDHTDARSVEFQRRQDILHQAMDAAGFELGSKREVWHFELPV